MAKKFFTERDIQRLVESGETALTIDADMVLTSQAYDHAKRLGFKIIFPEGKAYPPSQPIRPYLSKIKKPQPQQTAAVSPTPASPGAPVDDLSARIRAAVVARCGDQIDPQLLDTIIQRVLLSTGIK
ncbi:MAG: hypothetical protein AB1453_06510 [Chloroflexota bacterium]|jgi:hypothetical protein